MGACERRLKGGGGLGGSGSYPKMNFFKKIVFSVCLIDLMFKYKRNAFKFRKRGEIKLAQFREESEEKLKNELKLIWKR